MAVVCSGCGVELPAGSSAGVVLVDTVFGRSRVTDAGDVVMVDGKWSGALTIGKCCLDRPIGMFFARAGVEGLGHVEAVGEAVAS
ncbi:MAG: hypothetical protein AAGB10_22430 [Pseudomonadota bacterium]